MFFTYGEEEEERKLGILGFLLGFLPMDN